MALQQSQSTSVTAKQNSSEQYVQLFEAEQNLLCQNSAPAMNAKRAEALQHFKQLGIPQRKDERYKYTDMQAIFAPDYGLNLHRMPFSFRPEEVFSCDVPNLSTSVYFLMNDVFDVNSLPKGKLLEGVVVDSLKEYALKNPDFIEKYYAKLAATDKDGIAALNTMLAQDGLLVYVPKNTKVVS